MYIEWLSLKVNDRLHRKRDVAYIKKALLRVSRMPWRRQMASISPQHSTCVRHMASLRRSGPSSAALIWHSLRFVSRWHCDDPSDADVLRLNGTVTSRLV
jgi:hypothetical protein